MPERAKILLVDDRPENLTALEAILGALDQTLVRANSGDEALRALLNDDFAVILLDVQMPGLDGFETASHIKRRERTKDIPIIFLTAVSGGPHQTFRGYAAGAVDYIAKPFDPWILRAKVSVFIELHQKHQLLKEQAGLLTGRLGETAGRALQARRGGAAERGRSGPADGADQPDAILEEGSNTGPELVAELSARLAAVEEHARNLEKLAADPARDPVPREDFAPGVELLNARLARLRSALDALSP